jgi:hypothetical protein
MGCAALTDSNLPKGFWGFVFLWANYTLNRLPNKVTGNNNPFEVFHGYKPTLDQLRIFGSREFVLTPPELQNKLDDCAREARVIGYVDGGKGWMFWTPSDNKIVYLAWATFADDPLKSTTGRRPDQPHIDPGLEGTGQQQNNQTTDNLDTCIDPALQGPSVSAFRFVMAVELGDFSDEIKVGQQETLQDNIDQATKSPPLQSTPKTYKDILKHPERESWLKAIQEEL